MGTGFCFFSAVAESSVKRHLKGSEDRMKVRYPSDDRGAWFEFFGHPVNAPFVLVALGFLSMLVTALVLAVGAGNWADRLGFSSEVIWGRAEVWRFFTHVFWNPPSVWFVLEMFILWWFGRELEGYFGRRFFLRFCAGLVVVPAVCGFLIGGLLPGGHSVGWVGMPGSISLFVAYAAMAPGVPLFFGVSAAWTAAIFLGLQVLSCLSGHQWSEMVRVISGAGFAFGYVRYEQGVWDFGSWASGLGRRPKLRVLEKAAHSYGERGKRMDKRGGGAEDGAEDEESGVFGEVVDEVEAVDPLLEKIARSGIASLTVEERRQLEVAREALLRREGKGR